MSIRVVNGALVLTDYYVLRGKFGLIVSPTHPVTRIGNLPFWISLDRNHGPSNRGTHTITSPMFGIHTSTRLALMIGIAGAMIFWLATDIGIIPNPVKKRIDGRVNLSTAIAMHAAVAVEEHRLLEFEQVMKRTILTNPDILSVAIVKSNGQDAVVVGPHQLNWHPEQDKLAHHVAVDLYCQDRLWGELQVLFQPSTDAVASNIWAYPLSSAVFLGSVLTLLSWLVLNRTLSYLNPDNVVPNRVRSALDTLTEGLALIDKNGEIVHANKAFAEIVNVESEKLYGQRLDKYKFLVPDHAEEAHTSQVQPWIECAIRGEAVCGTIRELRVQTGLPRKFIINASPVFAEKDRLRGILVSFDDVTALENKKADLANMIHTLRHSRDEIARQNEQLTFLANCDPLTKCFNRRSLWAKFEELWQNVKLELLSIIMIDIDYFKSINDNHGHGTGDNVLRETGELLREIVGDRGLVCRYGGEEFCILVHNQDFESAVRIANEIHAEYQHRKLAGLDVTASFGVSNGSLGAMDMQHMFDQADQCLYAAKRQGRNQVVRFDECELDADEMQPITENKEPTIKYSTVTGLLSALAFRCKSTAEHSIRVADLSLAVGNHMLHKSELYQLEIAALLHDIGKIGVPDAILNKPGPLTDEEWKLMKRSDEIGVEIVKSAFGCDKTAEIVRCHHIHYSEQRSLSSRITGTQFPLESRIITACDAFDSMINNRTYRKGKSINQAIRELRRCTPDQFDPQVVEMLILHVTQEGFRQSQEFRIQTSSSSAVAIGKHLEVLQKAIANEDVFRIKDIVHQLKEDADVGNIQMISDAASRLESAIRTNDTELGQVLQLAEDVMRLCRSTRNAIVESASDSRVNPAIPLRPLQS